MILNTSSLVVLLVPLRMVLESVTPPREYKKANSATSAIHSPTPATGHAIPATKGTGAIVIPASTATTAAPTLSCLLHTNPTHPKHQTYNRGQIPSQESSL
jgi:hypothetical protein